MYSDGKHSFIVMEIIPFATATIKRFPLILPLALSGPQSRAPRQRNDRRRQNQSCKVPSS